MLQKFQSTVLLAALYLCGLSGVSSATTRAEAVNAANSYVHISSWTPINNGYTWADGTQFISNHSITSSYVDYPYVYGGKDTPAQFIHRVQEDGIAPGGLNQAEAPLDTKAIYDKEIANHEEPAKYLAGIDCSGFATLVLFGAPSQTLNADDLKNKSVAINLADLKSGDLLIQSGHIRVVTAIGASLSIVEAVGGTIGNVRVGVQRRGGSNRGSRNKGPAG